jgi:hypothetical protein
VGLDLHSDVWSPIRSEGAGTTASSPALPVAYVVLRILIVANWLLGAGILVLLVVSPHEQLIMAAFKLSPSLDTERLIMGLRAVAVLGRAAIPLHYAVFKKLLGTLLQN